MIEALIDVKTTDGYLLCLFCVGLLKKMQQSDSEDLLCSASTGPPNPEEDDNCDLRDVNDLREVVNKLIPDSTGKRQRKGCQSIYP